MSQNIQRVDHVIYAVRPENQKAYVEQMSKLCGINFHGPTERPKTGLRTYINWSAGINIVAAVSDAVPIGAQIASMVEQRGEGLIGIAFGVADMMKARQHAQDLGYDISDLIQNDGTEPYAAETEIMLETVVGNIMNNMFLFAEVKLTPDALK